MFETGSSSSYDGIDLHSLLLSALTGEAEHRFDFEGDPATWLTTMFPAATPAGFAPHHLDFWQWVWVLQPGIRPAPLVVYWPRGGAKSSSAEMACVAVGALAKRRYVLYVSGTQDLADKHVSDIARKLETEQVEQYYPLLGRREVSKYGISRGWSGSRLRTASGFMVDAIGLNAAVRGIKVGDYRPDLIVFDDIDSLKDTPAAVEEKIETLTQSVLPAGSTDAAILGVQNLIHPNSIFSRLAGVSEHRADFLTDRIRTPVIPAIAGMATERQGDRDVIVAGRAVWSGQSLAECQGKIDSFGLRAFLRESQHEVEAASGEMFDAIDFRHCTPEELPRLERIVVWIDPAVSDEDQSDSHGIQAAGSTRDGTIYVVWSWEQRASPDVTVRTALLKAIELGASEVGFEINQGGDLWRIQYNALVKELREAGEIPAGAVIPRFATERASKATGDKATRASRMLFDYQRNRIVHVLGTHHVLERALRRFPKTKPFDLVDASYYAWHSLTGNTGPEATRAAVSPPRNLDAAPQPAQPVSVPPNRTDYVIK